jgi:hypothetical protein
MERLAVVFGTSIYLASVPPLQITKSTTLSCSPPGTTSLDPTPAPQPSPCSSCFRVRLRNHSPLALSPCVVLHLGRVGFWRRTLSFNMTIPAPSPSQPALSHDRDGSHMIKTTTWILLGITIAVFLARQVVKAIVVRRVGLDDVFFLLAMVSQ